MDIAKIVLDFLKLGHSFECHLRVVALNLDGQRSARADADDALHVREAFNLLPVDHEDKVTRLESCRLCSASRLHSIDAGAGCLLADGHEDAGENRNSQHEVSDRASRDNHCAPSDRLELEAV